MQMQFKNQEKVEPMSNRICSLTICVKKHAKRYVFWTMPIYAKITLNKNIFIFTIYSNNIRSGSCIQEIKTKN